MADKIFIDGVTSFPNGINSGVAPALLDRQTLSFSTNATVRGAYIHQRPAFRLIPLDFLGSAVVQFNFEQNLWQGAAFFASEYGFQALICAIGGHIFQLKPDADDNWSVTDVSIVGDLNSSANPIAWLWQSERWMIINDGDKLPQFYDGATNRRSFGAAQLLGTTAAPFIVPNVGGTVQITLTTNYTGPVNQVIYIEDVVTGTPKALYQVNSAAAGYTITVQNLSEDPAITPTQAAGSQVQIPQNLAGQLNADATPAPGIIPVAPFWIPLVGAPNLNVLSNIFFFTAPSLQPFKIVTDFAYDPRNDSVYVRTSGINYASWLIWFAGSTGPAVPNLTAMSVEQPIGSPVVTSKQYSAVYKGPPNLTSPLGLTLSQPFANPAVGASGTIFLDNPYNGALNTTVVINGGLYLITASNNTLSPTNLITVQNIGDTPLQVNAAGTILTTVPELPAGKMGAYGLGRNWEALVDGRSYIGSDIVGGSSGSPALNFRDSVLHTTENTFLAGGGVFVVPGNVGDIQSLTFGTVLDTSLGQGPLEIGTPNIIFSCNAPIDRTTWQAVTNPIQTEALKGAGTLNQYGTINVNSDILFRSFLGESSFAIARREFTSAGSWGNTPISREMSRVYDADSIDLLGYGSKVEFQNRVLSTARPTPGSQGTFHLGTTALNLDPVSSLRGKAPSLWDGLWTGLNVMQLVKGRISNDERAWAFGFNTIQSKIELYEIERDGIHLFDFDGISEKRIQWSFETAVLFQDVAGKGPFDACKLIGGEFYVSDVVGVVDYSIFYRPQFAPCFVHWFSGQICADERDVTNPADDLVKPANKVMIGLPDPAYVCDPVNNRPYKVAESFQFKLVFTGPCKFYGAKFKAALEPDPFFVKVECKPICVIDLRDVECKPCDRLECQGDADFDYKLQDRPAPPPPEIFYNTQVQFCLSCEEGETPTFTGTPAPWISFDEDSGCLLGAANTYQAESQAGANLLAQEALDAFASAAIANGDLVCASAECGPTYIIQGYFDGLVANATGSVPAGEPVWDGKYVYLSAVGSVAGADRNTQQFYQMGSKLICNNYITRIGGPGFRLIFYDSAGGILWQGDNNPSAVICGVYTRTSGSDVGPATITIISNADAPLAVGGSDNCAPS